MCQKPEQVNGKMRSWTSWQFVPLQKIQTLTYLIFTSLNFWIVIHGKQDKRCSTPIKSFSLFESLLKGYFQPTGINLSVKRRNCTRGSDKILSRKSAVLQEKKIAKVIIKDQLLTNSRRTLTSCRIRPRGTCTGVQHIKHATLVRSTTTTLATLIL